MKGDNGHRSDIELMVIMKVDHGLMCVYVKCL